MLANTTIINITRCRNCGRSFINQSAFDAAHQAGRCVSRNAMRAAGLIPTVRDGVYLLAGSIRPQAVVAPSNCKIATQAATDVQNAPASQPRQRRGIRRRLDGYENARVA